MGLVLNMIQVNHTCEFFKAYLGQVDADSEEEEDDICDQIAMIEEFQDEYLEQAKRQLMMAREQLAHEFKKGAHADVGRIDFLVQYCKHLEYDLEGDWR